MLSTSSASFANGNGEDISIVEDSNTKKDVKKSIADGVPSIDFSDRVYQILEKEMSTLIILKILGRNIGISTLQNKLYGIWRPSKPFQLMNIENGYFLAKFQNSIDYDKVLSQGPWVIFDYYLTVQPWSIDFNSNLHYPNLIQTWIRFPRPPSHLYKRQILMEIGSLIGKITKLDINTDSRARGRYARIVVFVNLGKPLISKILINDLEASSLEQESTKNPKSMLESKGKGILIDSDVNVNTGRKDVGNGLNKTNLNWPIGQGRMEHEFPSIKQANHVVVYNPVFEENSFMNVKVKEGVLDARNHSTVVFNNKRSLETGDSAGSNLVKVGCKSQIAKKSISKVRWKLNKTLKGPGNRFKISENSRVSFADSMKRAATLITSEIEEQSAKDLSRRLEQEVDISSSAYSFSRLILVAFVYGSPDKVKKNIFWNDLSRSILVRDEPWMAIGDFNTKATDGSEQWELFGFFLDCVVTPLPRIKSDHHSLLLNLYSQVMNVFNRSFRFLAGWLQHHNFSDFVKENWSFDGNMTNAIVGFTDRLKNWNNCVYGHISQRKCRLMHKHSNVQRVVDLSGSNSLRHKEFMIREELESIFYHEEIFWKQKSRYVDFLGRNVMSEEIKVTLFDMAPFKDPGSDGFQAGFFQKQWEIIVEDICDWVKNVFDGEIIDPEFNNTLIVLISKVQNPENFSQFRPINLSSILYKLVMKIIANRFKVIFPKIIGQEQAGFIVG
ncbi:hypothetical protein PVK06_042517 [Gossypium arboreum]|uniref:DUF4283 domain-containing protein n=1 Tax=Gossypium arboreum TaxID=29729 RepID=A0ABR0MKX8_GOSAR|nr:hypothetical protein PVK06_042517 [Gossypium arboreum]